MDNLKMIGLEDIDQSFVIRRVKTFVGVTEKARKPLAKVLESDLLIHCQKTGKAKLPTKVPVNVAIDIFREVSLGEIKSKGYATTGEIYLAFAKEIMGRFHEPPPDFDYVNLLDSDPDITAEEVHQEIGRKVEKVTAWRLKGHKHPGKITTYFGD